MGQGQRTGAHTRRGFIAGASAGAAVQLLPWGAIDALAQTPKPCTPNQPGAATVALAVTPSGRTVWTTDNAARTITAHRARDLTAAGSIEVGGAPIAIAITPDGRRAAVLTAAYDRPGLALVDLRARRVLARVDVGSDPCAVALTPDGRTALVTGGGAKGTLTRVSMRGGRVLPAIALGRHPRGVAVAPDGRRAYVAVNGDATVAVVSLTRGRIARRIATAAYPGRIAVTPDGTRAMVTHDGADHRVTPLDLVAGRAHRPVTVAADPAGIVFDRTGKVAVVTESGNGTVAVLSARSGRRLRRVAFSAGTAPRAIAAAGDGVVVADWHTGALTRIARVAKH